MNQLPSSHTATNPLRLYRKNLSIIAAAMIFIGYFLPWVSVVFTQQNMYLSDAMKDIPTFSGASLLSTFFKGLEEKEKAGVDTFSLWALLVFVFLIMTPLSALVFGLQRFNDKDFKQIPVATFSTASATFVPLLLFFTFYFTSDAVRMAMQQMPFNSKDVNIGIGIGALLMAMGAFYLLYDAFINLTILKLVSETIVPLLGKAAAATALYYIFAYMVNKMVLQSLNFSENSLNILLLLNFCLFISAPFATIAAHKHFDLGNKISYQRSVGAGVLTMLFIIFIGVFILKTDNGLGYMQHYLPLSSNFIAFLAVIHFGFILSSFFGIFLEDFDYKRALSTQNTNETTTAIIPPQQQDSAYAQLEKLAELKALGVLTDAEFEMQKQKILNQL